MRKLLLLILILLFASLAEVQSQRTQSNPLGGNLTVQDAGTCSTNNSFLWQVLPVNAGTTTVNLAGTFTATVTFRESNNGGGTWTSAGTSSAAGTTTFSTNGFTDFCVDVTAFTSGSVAVSISTGLQQVQSVVSGGSGSGGGSSGPNIRASTAKWDGKRGLFPNVTTTNGSNQVTVSTATFTSSDVGKLMFCTNWGGTDGYGSTAGNTILIGNTTPNGFPTVISSIVNATTVALQTNGSNQNAVASSDASHGLCFWGTDDTAAHQADFTAITPANGICGTLQLGSGDSFDTQPLWNTGTCIGGGTGQNSKYASVVGAGRDGTSTLVIPPWANLTTASCPAGGLFFGSMQGIGITDVTIYGGGGTLNGQTINCNIMGTTIDGTIERDMVLGLGSSANSLTGFRFAGGYHVVSVLTIDGGGLANCVAGGTNQSSIYAIFCGNSLGQALVVQAGGFFHAEGITTQCIGGNATCIQNNGTMILSKWFGLLGGASALSHIFTPAGGISIVHNSIANANLAGGAVFNVQGSGKQYAFNNPLLQATGAGSSVWLCQAASGCFDEGGNLYSNTVGNAPTCTFTSGGGTSPSCAIQAGSTNEKGTIIASTGTGSPGTTGTITLNFFGTFTGATGATPSCSFTPNDSGTAWGNGALTKVSTQSTTAPIVAWSNSAANVLTALATSSPFRIDYVCVPR